MKPIATLSLAWVLLSGLTLSAQLPRDKEACPTIGRMPADRNDTKPSEDRAWFELHQCDTGLIIVKAYEPHQTTPTLAFDTGDGYPIKLVHIVNVLAFESLGGSANHVYVFTFHDRKPDIRMKRSTAGGIVVRQEGDAVVITVPVKTYPDSKGKFRSVPDATYIFPLEY